MDDENIIIQVPTREAYIVEYDEYYVGTNTALATGACCFFIGPFAMLVPIFCRFDKRKRRTYL